MDSTNKTVIDLLTSLSNNYYLDVDSLFTKHHFLKYKQRSVLNSSNFPALFSNSNFNFNLTPEQIFLVNHFSFLGILELSWEEFLDGDKVKSTLDKVKSKLQVHLLLENHFGGKFTKLFKLAFFPKLSEEIRKLDNTQKISLLITSKEIEDEILLDLDLFTNISLFFNIGYKEILENLQQVINVIESSFLDSDGSRYKWLNIFLISKAVEANYEKVLLPEKPIGYLGPFIFSFDELTVLNGDLNQDYRFNFSQNKIKLTQETETKIRDIVELVKTIPNNEIVYSHFYESLKLLSGKETEGMMHLKSLLDLIDKQESFVYSKFVVEYEHISEFEQLKNLSNLITNNNLETFERNEKLLEIFINVIDSITNTVQEYNENILPLFQHILDTISVSIARGTDLFFKVNNVSIFDFVSSMEEIIDLMDGAFPGGLSEIIKICLSEKVKNPYIVILKRVNRYVNTKYSIVSELVKKGESEYLKTITEHFGMLWQKATHLNQNAEEEMDVLLYKCSELIEKSQVLPENSIKALGEMQSDSVLEYLKLLTRILLNHISYLESSNLKIEEDEKEDFEIMEGVFYNLLKICFAAGIDFSMNTENQIIKFEVKN